MTTIPLRRVAAPAAALALGLGVAACTPPNEQPASGTVGAGGVLAGTLNGAGASSQEAAMSAWQAGFQTANPQVTVNYDPVGSGGGREQFLAGGTAFAGSDAYLSEDDGELEKATERCNGEHPIEIPNYVSPIAVIYNLDGVDDLQLSGSTLAGIFAGEITRWDDPAIVKDNPDAKMPAERITPVHRADDSGTTDNFTAYLEAADSKAWPHGEVGVWPIKDGEAANGTSGVVSAVKNGANSIGYADASQAGRLGTAAIKVGEDFVGPDADAAAKVLEVSPRVEGRPEADLAFELDRSTTESGVYPIVLASYLIACPLYSDQETADMVKGFLSYVVGVEGQAAAADTAGSAPLPNSLQAEALSIIGSIKAQG